MRKPGSYLLTGALALMTVGSAVPQDVPTITNVTPKVVVRGSPVIATGTSLPKDPATLSVFLGSEEVTPLMAGEKSFTFVVPGKISLGKYPFRASWTEEKDAETLEHPIVVTERVLINVVSASGDQPEVTAIYPPVVYPDEGRLKFRILGKGFGLDPYDNVVVIANQEELDVEWNGGSGGGDQEKPTGRLESDRQLDVELPQETYEGALQVQVRVGDKSSDAIPVTFSRVGRWTPLMVSLSVLLALLVIVALFLRTGSQHKIAGESTSKWTVLFLDNQTNAYSMAKFQFYLWTLAAVFGYSYLTVARTLIQGQFEFAEIPEGLPGIIAISGGATIGAVGVASYKGAMGAGEVQPSFADFVSSGGIVVPERIQFLVWTLLGVVAFLFLVIANDPGNIQELPKIPDGFLALMGVSSAGYVGGKIARKPGPIISDITAMWSSLDFLVVGSHLSPSAKLEIKLEDTNEPEPKYEEITDDMLKGEESDPKRKVKVLEFDEPRGEGQFAKRLKFVIDDEEIPERVRKHLESQQGEGKELKESEDGGTPRFASMLVLTNPDGQRAVWPFAVKGERREKREKGKRSSVRA